jgi:hypothetical protein
VNVKRTGTRRDRAGMPEIGARRNIKVYPKPSPMLARCCSSELSDEIGNKSENPAEKSRLPFRPPTVARSEAFWDRVLAG